MSSRWRGAWRQLCCQGVRSPRGTTLGCLQTACCYVETVYVTWAAQQTSTKHSVKKNDSFSFWFCVRNLGCVQPRGKLFPLLIVASSLTAGQCPSSASAPRSSGRPTAQLWFCSPRKLTAGNSFPKGFFAKKGKGEQKGSKGTSTGDVREEPWRWHSKWKWAGSCWGQPPWAETYRLK